MSKNPNRFDDILSDEPSQQVTPAKVSHTVLVLDASGSMDPLCEEALETVNAQIKAAQAAQGILAKVSLITFGTMVDEPVFWDRPAVELEPLDKDDYKPDGMTSMLDAVGTAIDRLRALPDADTPESIFLVMTISDGAENNSKKETYESLAEKIQACKKTGRWTFTYAGSNQDLSVITDKLGVDIGNIMKWKATKQGTVHLKAATVRGMDQYYVSAAKGEGMSTNCSNFYGKDSEDPAVPMTPLPSLPHPPGFTSPGHPAQPTPVVWEKPSDTAVPEDGEQENIPSWTSKPPRQS